jgi:hypothetical protein
MADSDTTTITLRIPAGLKLACEATASTRGQTLTSLVIDALQAQLTPKGPLHELPGFSKQFQEVLDKLTPLKDKPTPPQDLLLLVRHPITGVRGFYDGTFDPKMSNDSIVSIVGGDRDGALVPRSEIVAWFGPMERKFCSLIQRRLLEEGWTRLPPTRH